MLAEHILTHPLLWRETRAEMADLLGLSVEAAAALSRSDQWDVRPLMAAQQVALAKLAA